MTILLYIFAGLFKVLRYWRVIVLVVFIQLLLAWVLGYPLSSTLESSWDHSLLPEQLNHPDIIKATAIEEVVVNNSDKLSSFYSFLPLATAGIFYVLFTTFIVAGVLPLYLGLDLKFNWDRFLSDASRYFRSFIGLIIISAFFFLAADFLSNLLHDFIQHSMEGSNDEAAVFVATVILDSAFRFILFALTIMTFQYAKILAVNNQLRNIVYLIRNSLSFVIRNFITVLVMFGVLALIEQGVQILDITVWHYALQGAGPIALWLWLIFSTFLLTTIKFSYFASQGMLYNELTKRERDSRNSAFARSPFGRITDY